ncbi:relaxase/mobilization nuclease domain-containing protein [Mucilaginibacter sp. PAMB04274]|uniref:relaxase/mobilization nuclease domain-containing protein n=1 Tax=Mucilaginibacter sp. PAMB04274 TaxID=3138568 RepID=UPI0031F68D88
MVVKILSSSATFSGVTYNTDKVERDKGELMLVRNFGSLQGLEKLRPEDYSNYLKMLSAQNPRVRKPQFHTAISAKGTSSTKEALTEIAVRWLEAMGYGQQPYLVVFHKDTDNHHVHVVSTRIGRDGKKISSAFERVRAVQQLNRIMGTDFRQNVANDISDALGYRFSNSAQFMLILESRGYVLKTVNEQLEVVKFGQKLQNIPLKMVSQQAAQFTKDVQRQRQLKAIFQKYSSIYQTALKNDKEPLAGGRSKVLSGLASDLSRFLEIKFGLKLIFHSKDDQPAYGYSIIDHSGKAVWKGSEIMPLKELLSRNGQHTFDQRSALGLPEIPKCVSHETSKLYAALLKAAIRNYPDIGQGLTDLGLSFSNVDGRVVLSDPAAGIQVPVDELLEGADTADWSAVEAYAAYKGYDYVPPVSIAEDIDDEQINGRSRRRKKKARTNTR